MTATIDTPPRTDTGGLAEVLKLAWPLVLTNGCWTAQIFLDRVFLNQYSGADMAATLPAVLVFWALLNLFFHTCAYVASFVSQYTGAGRPRRIGPAIGQALHFAVIGGLFFLALSTVTTPIFALTGHDADLQAREAIFMRCLCFGAFPELVKVCCFSFFNGRGETRVVLGISIVCLAVNAGLDYCWIFGRYGFPEWGIAGAGWSTATASAIGAALALGLMLRRRYREEFATNEIFKFERSLFVRLMEFGIPNGLFIAIETAAFGAFTLILGWFGSVELAASNMAFTLNMVAFLPTMGIGQAVEILVSRYLGEDRPDKAERRTWISLGIAWGLMTTVAIAFFVLPDVVLWPFVQKGNDEIVAMAKVILRFIAFYTLFDAGNLIFSFALRGAGDTRFVTKVMSGMPWVGMVIPTYFAYRFGWGIYWAWGFASAYIALLAFVFYARFRNGAWKSMRVIEPTPVE